MLNSSLSVSPRTVGDRLSGAVRADVANVRATPTAKALLLGSVVMAIASCVANLSVVADSELETEATIQLAMHASTVATLIFALVAGVVSATADFRFGRVDQLLLTEPNRSIHLAAKALVGTLVGVAYGIIGSIAAVGATAGFFAAKNASIDVLSAPVVQPLVGLLFGAGLFGACGVAVGIIVRSQPAAIAGSLAWMLIVEPTALLGLPSVGRWLPGAGGLALTRSPDPNLLDPPAGGLLLLGWTCAAITLALSRFRQSDV